MSRLLLTAAVLAVLVYTMVLGVRWLSPRIEQDIADRVTTGLAEQGLLWADVEVQGRDVVLAGTAPDADAKARAVSVVSRVFGVSKVTDNLVVAGSVSDTVAGVSATDVKPVKAAKVKKPKVVEDYALTISKDGEKITLEGNVPDEQSKAVLIKLAETHYEKANVDGSKLTVVEGAPAGWRSAVGAVLMHISNMEEAKAVISGTEVMVSGSVLDKEFSDKMEADVVQVLPKDYKAAFAVDVVTPTVADVEPAAGEDASATKVAAACERKVELKAQTLMFGFDKADLTDEHKAKIKTVAAEMVNCADDKMVMAGYTDVTGSKLYNKWLSQQRAEAAMRGMIREGVEKERLKAVGYGEKFPVASNANKNGRAANRRVEFVAGDVLPHGGEAVVAKEPAKAKKVKAEKKAEAKKVEKKAEATVTEKAAKVVSETTTTVVKETKEAAAKTKAVAVSATETVVSETKAIAKPWWARKTVSDTSVEMK